MGGSHLRTVNPRFVSVRGCFTPGASCVPSLRKSVGAWAAHWVLRPVLRRVRQFVCCISTQVNGCLVQLCNAGPTDLY